MKLFLFMFVIVLMSISCSKLGKESGNDESMIRAARDRSNQSIKERDTVSLAALWTEDFHMISSRNSEVSGRDANSHRFANEFQTRPDVIYIRTPEKIEAFPDWNMAAENGSWTGRWTDNDSKIEVKGSYYAKWHKVNGEWLIRSEVFTALSCEGGKFCKDKPI